MLWVTGITGMVGMAVWALYKEASSINAKIFALLE